MRISIQDYKTVFDLIVRDAIGSGPVLVLVAHDADAICACRILKVCFTGVADLFPRKLF